MGRRRTKKACSECRRMKRKCDNGEPCEQCKVRGLQCDKRCPVGRSTKLVHTDRRTSANTANSYTYFYYRIREKSFYQQGFGYALEDGNLIVDPGVVPVLQEAMSMLEESNDQIICCGDLTIEILRSEKRQPAKLSMLHNGQVCVTAEFFGEAPGQGVGVTLWKIADSTTRKLGPAQWIESERWCITMNYNDLIGHVVIFTRRQREEVISVPVPPGPNKSPLLESSLSWFHESTSSSAPFGSAVGSPQAELEPTAWMYETSTRKDIIIKYNSVCYTYRAHHDLRSQLVTLVGQQAGQARYSTQLSITPYRIHYCTEKYIENYLHLEANFSKDVSNRFISIKVYSPSQKGRLIHAQRHNQASQCSVSIDMDVYHGNIIVFNCDDEYIVSFPVKQPWQPSCDRQLCEMKRSNMDDLDIYDAFSSCVKSNITEDLEWYSRSHGRFGAMKRKRAVSELVRSGTEFHWRRDRQNLEEEFHGMEFRAFKTMWQAACKDQGHSPALHFN